MLREALHYRSLGLSTIPLRSGGKEPLMPWSEFQTRRAEIAEVSQWLTRHPTANIGVVTGAVSGVVVVDCDGQAGIRKADELGLRSNVVSITGNGGQHRWFRYQEGVKSQTLWTGPNPHEEVAIKSDLKYVVAPPSIHENGRRYRFIGNINALNTLPDFPMNLIVTKQVGTHTNNQPKSDSWIAKALGGMKNGNIDDTLVSVLGRLRRDDYTREDARIMLAPHAERAGATPGHLEDKIENVWSRYPAAEKRTQPLPTGGRSIESLVIHSPTNPDSLKRYEHHSVVASTESGLQTGYPKLDAMFHGGLKSSRLLVVGARTGVGKSNIVIGISKNLCAAGKRVLLFSTEMPYEEIWTRYKATLKADEDFGKHEFYVCDSFAPNLEKVEQAISEIKPDVFIFDHINHISEDVRPLGEFMQGLNWLKRKYECAGIVTAQLNRAADWVENGKKVEPRLSMIKGSGTIEQAASRVLLLNEVRVTPEMTEIQGIVAKNDNGQKGMVMFGLLQSPWRIEEL